MDALCSAGSAERCCELQHRHAHDFIVRMGTPAFIFITTAKRSAVVHVIARTYFVFFVLLGINEHAGKAFADKMILAMIFFVIYHLNEKIIVATMQRQQLEIMWTKTSRYQ